MICYGTSECKWSDFNFVQKYGKVFRLCCQWTNVNIELGCKMSSINWSYRYTDFLPVKRDQKFTQYSMGETNFTIER